MTERSNHAREMVADDKELFDRFDGVVVVGGDGLVFEVVNVRLRLAYRPLLHPFG